MEDRATKILEKWTEAYARLLATGMPEEDIIAGLIIAIQYLAEKDPELLEEMTVTAQFENLLNGIE